MGWRSIAPLAVLVAGLSGCVTLKSITCTGCNNYRYVQQLATAGEDSAQALLRAGKLKRGEDDAKRIYEDALVTIHQRLNEQLQEYHPALKQVRKVDADLSSLIHNYIITLRTDSAQNASYQKVMRGEIGATTTINSDLVRPNIMYNGTERDLYKAALHEFVHMNHDALLKVFNMDPGNPKLRNVTFYEAWATLLTEVLLPEGNMPLQQRFLQAHNELQSIVPEGAPTELTPQPLEYATGEKEYIMRAKNALALYDKFSVYGFERGAEEFSREVKR